MLSGIYKIWALRSIQQKRIMHVLLLVLAGSLVYSNSITVPFILDDHYSIDHFGKINLLEHLLHGGARRVVDITFALNHRIHGLQVAGYHITNLAIHISSAILVYFIMISALSALRISFAVKECAEERSNQVERFIPLAVALLFAIHPIQTQAVTYIIQRYTSLATFFYLLSILLFFRARLAIEMGRLCWKTWFLFGCTLVTGLLAIYSKQIAVTLPLMLFCLEIYLFRGRQINRRFLIMCGIIFIIITAIILVKWHESTWADFLFDVRHATSEDLFTSRTSYFLTQTRVVVTYLSLLCLPLGQSLVHDSQTYNSVFSLPVMASLVVHVFLVTTAAILFRSSRQNFLSDDWLCGALQRLASFGIIWFYIGLAIESSIFPIRDVIFEHRIYLSSVGFFITVVAVLALTVRGRQAVIKIAWTLFVIVCILLGSVTIARNQVWNDPLTLWQDAASKSPNKWLALANLAGEYRARNMPEKSLPLYLRAIELNSNLFILTKIGLGDSLKALNLFGSRFTTGKEYLVAGGLLGTGTLDYKNMSKFDSVISNNMGLSYEYLQKPEMAIKAYKMSAVLNPEYDLAWYNLSLLASRSGDKELADLALKQLGIINTALAKDILSR